MGVQGNTDRFPFPISSPTTYTCHFILGVMGELPYLGSLRWRSSTWVFIWQGLLPILCLLPLRICRTGNCSHQLCPRYLAFSDKLMWGHGVSLVLLLLFVALFFSLESFPFPSPSIPFLFLSSFLWDLFSYWFQYTSGMEGPRLSTNSGKSIAEREIIGGLVILSYQ